MLKQPLDPRWFTSNIQRTSILRCFWRRSDIAKMQSEGHKMILSLLRQAKLVDLRVIASTRCARFIGLKMVAPTRYARLVSLRVVAFDKVR